MASLSGTLDLERSIYVGNSFAGIMYGAQVYMYFHTLALIKQRKAFDGTRGTFYAVYSTVMLALTTLTVVSNALMGQRMWIDHRDYPGGPPAYFDEYITAPWQTLGSATSIITNFMGDGLLVYRAYLIWNQSFLVLFSTGALYLASTAMSIITVVESSHPGNNIFEGLAVSMLNVWIGLTVSLNIIVTLIISIKLLLMRRRTQKIMINSQMTSTYTSIIAILVESALPFTAIGIAFLAATVKGSDTELSLAYIWGGFTSFTPQLIILRIALGQGWTKETVKEMRTGTMPQFAKSSEQRTTFDGGLSTRDPTLRNGESDQGSRNGESCSKGE